MINEHGYGTSTSGAVGFSDVLTVDDDGKALTYCDADQFADGDYYMEVVSLDLWESRNGKDFLKVWLADGRGKLTRLFGSIGAKTMWKLDRAIDGIFYRRMPVEEIQASNGRMPVATRESACGIWVKVSIKSSGYGDEQDVLIVDGQFSCPDGAKAMFKTGSTTPTGNWPTTAAEFRGVKSDDIAGDDDGW